MTKNVTKVSKFPYGGGNQCHIPSNEDQTHFWSKWSSIKKGFQRRPMYFCVFHVFVQYIWGNTGLKLVYPKISWYWLLSILIENCLQMGEQRWENNEDGVTSLMVSAEHQFPPVKHKRSNYARQSILSGNPVFTWAERKRRSIRE